MEEKWLPVTHPEFSHAYEISDHGRLKSLPRKKKNRLGEWITKEKIISPGRHPYGYHVVCLKADGNVKMERIHRLVALAFIPNPFGFPSVNHLDCNPENNHVSNLEWCDQKHNMNYASKMGRCDAKLTWEKVAVIRKLRAEGKGLVEIAKLFGVGHTCISAICRGKTWKLPEINSSDLG
jgi:hypothetical protein